ncbi:MAG: methionine synthase, partial [Duncaniella sp.]|nr:methionine synthase [Duncaniella sp.]
ASRGLADYIAPDGDYAGAFAVSIDFADEVRGFESAGDSYRSLLVQSLAHRCAEAASEWLHAKVRRELWGYAPAEDLSVKELFQARYSGIRPAVGYPSLPDQKLTFTLDRLLGLAEIGVSLTDNGAMEPSATVCGLYIAHPESSYFMLGRIADDQIADYGGRRSLEADEVKSLLGY